MSKRSVKHKPIALIMYPDLSLALGKPDRKGNWQADDKQAIVLSQLYYWVSGYAKKPDKNKKHYRDGHWWTYGSIADWQADQFISWGEKTVERKFKELRNKGFVVKSEKDYNEKKFNEETDVSWYRINFAKLHEDIPLTKDIFPDIDSIKPKVLYDDSDNMTEGKRQNDVRGLRQNDDGGNVTVTEGLRHNDVTNTLYPSNTSTNIIEPYTSLSDSDNKLLRRLSDIINDSEQIKDKDKAIVFFGRYLEEYQSSRNTEHGFVSDRTLRTAVQNVIDLKAYEHTEIIQDYFATEYRQGCDYRIGHLTNKKILQKRLEAVSQPEQTEQKDSGTWRDSLRYLQRNDIDDLMRYYVPARKEGLDLRKLSDAEYADYIWDDTHGVRLDYSEDREFICQCLDELLQLIDKPETEDSIIDEPHIKPETHILPEVEDDEWLDYGQEEQLPF